MQPKEISKLKRGQAIRSHYFSPLIASTPQLFAPSSAPSTCRFAGRLIRQTNLANSPVTTQTLNASQRIGRRRILPATS
jgi:hypothetical protein